MGLKKSIAIMTYWGYNDNYGQLFQAYALSTYLTKLGHHVRLIKYDHMNDKSTKRSILSRIFTMAYHPKQLVMGVWDRLLHIFTKTTFDNCPCEESFKSFKNLNLKWTELYPTYQSLIENPPNVEVYICGSDMIWAESAYYPDPFFLAFGNPEKRVAYAPSFGRKKVTKPYAKYITKLLSGFDAISVREESGIGICQQAGCKNSICVPDPTLLLTQNEYSSIEESYHVTSNYVFVYILGKDGQHYFSKILQKAEEQNLGVVYRAAQGADDDGFQKAYPTPGQWLSLIKKSTQVFTNSFHGVVFSIIYRKPFTYLPLKGKSASSNERVYSLLAKFNLIDRIWNPKEILTINKSYTKDTENRINSFIYKGLDFIDQNV